MELAFAEKGHLLRIRPDRVRCDAKSASGEQIDVLLECVHARCRVVQSEWLVIFSHGNLRHRPTVAVCVSLQLLVCASLCVCVCGCGGALGRLH